MGKQLRRNLSYAAGLGKGILAARKWLLAYVAIILLPSCLLLVSYYQRSSRILEEEVTASMQQTIRQAGLNLTYKLEHINETANSIFMNQILYDNLVKEEGTIKQAAQMKELRNLAALAQENKDIARMRLFVDDSRLYAGEGVNLFAMERLERMPWHEAVMAAGGGMVWTGVYRENYTDTGEATIFSAARMLRNPRQYEEMVGVLVMDIPARVMEELLSDLHLSAQFKPFLVNESNDLVYSSGMAAANQPADAGGPSVSLLPDSLFAMTAQAGEGILKRELGREEVYVIYSTIGITGWKLVAQVSQEEISHRAAARNQLSGIVTLGSVTLLFLLLVFVLLAFTVQAMKRRVQNIIMMIRREGIEWLEERRTDPAGDFLLLEHSVDHLIHKVNRLMEEAYIVKVKEREAQLRALQAQINPHFLYNALDMINWSAIAHGAEDTSQMIEALALYFRLSLNKGQDNVSIADELNLAGVYLEIQQSRFPSTFTFRIESDPRLERYLIPKLTLQPIVENALLHGIRRTKQKKGAIYIKAAVQDEAIILSVQDDGIGMERELAANLLLEPRPSERTDGSGSSYGLYNVNERIRIFAGEAYGLSIETAPNEGTTVTVRLKASFRTGQEPEENS